MRRSVRAPHIIPQHTRWEQCLDDHCFLLLFSRLVPVTTQREPYDGNELQLLQWPWSFTKTQFSNSVSTNTASSRQKTSSDIQRPGKELHPSPRHCCRFSRNLLTVLPPPQHARGRKKFGRAKNNKEPKRASTARNVFQQVMESENNTCSSEWTWQDEGKKRRRKLDDLPPPWSSTFSSDHKLLWCPTLYSLKFFFKHDANNWRQIHARSTNTH